MIGRTPLFWLAAASALWHVPASAADAVRLAPSSEWYLNYADDSCRLARQFGEGKRTSVLIIDQFEPGDYFRLTVAGELFDDARASSDATLRFGPGESEQEHSFMIADLGDRPALMFPGGMRIAPMSDEEEKALDRVKGSDEAYQFELPPIGPERESAATYLSIDAPGTQEVVLETGSLGGPMVDLRRCMNELLTHWGIDVERHKSLTRKLVPTDSPGSWLNSRDYPTDLLRDGAQGLVNFRLSVDEKGDVSGCHIQRSTRPEGFDRAVCDALKRRARFEPALDADGNPVNSYFIGSVNFVMP